MKKTNNYRYENRNNEYEWKRVWKYHSEADNLYHRRFSFFLVAESMLIVSFASLFRIKSAEHIKFAIIILGLIYTFGWYYVNVRLDKKMEFLKQYLLEKEDRFFYGYMNCVNDNAGNLVIESVNGSDIKSYSRNQINSLENIYILHHMLYFSVLGG